MLGLLVLVLGCLSLCIFLSVGLGFILVGFVLGLRLVLALLLLAFLVLVLSLLLVVVVVALLTEGVVVVVVIVVLVTLPKLVLGRVLLLLVLDDI